MKYLLIITVIFFFLPGCSPYEAARLAGISTRPFKTQGKIYKQTFDKEISGCYPEVKKIINELGATAYRGKLSKGFIVSLGYSDIYPSANYSTEVAIFFKMTGKNKTVVQVSSLNYGLSKSISEKIFEKLSEAPSPAESN